MDARRARQHRRSCFPKATARPLFKANTSRRRGSSSQPPPAASRNGLDPETASSTVRMRYAYRRDAYSALDIRHEGRSDEDDHLDLTTTTRGARTAISDT
ncbi:hypothetical protein MRX96_000620 [Rhipicephalus microplus]